jgi:hypothetical protein
VGKDSTEKAVVLILPLIISTQAYGFEICQLQLVVVVVVVLAKI